jgi:para-nitrobenzyl esterase
MRRCYRNFPRSLVTAAFAASALVAHAAEVTVTGARVSGTELAGGGTFFSDIPYGAPPVGSFRWRPPQPVVPWQGLRDATLPSTPCLQLSQGWNKAAAEASKEDCLYLSIRSPRHRPAERLPVIFWVHGGSNVAGDGYGPARDAAVAERGVVVVAPEYRLGVFGFLGSPELTAESPQHVSGNYALLDLIAALQWVKANIALFGGDPGNITLAGQSAGALSISLCSLCHL